MLAKNTDNKNYNIYIIILFILIGTVIYSNTLNVPFYFDDHSIIKDTSMRIDSLSYDTVAGAGRKALLQKRPVSNISFALNYYFNEYNVRGYHAVNIIIHIITSIILYYLIRTTLSLPVNNVRYTHIKMLAFTASFLWLVHPLATQSVTYIVQRMNSMAALFYIASILFYAKARVQQKKYNLSTPAIQPWLYFLLIITSGLLAIGSKEIAATLPIMILFYEMYFFQPLNLRSGIKLFCILILAAVFAGFLALWYLGPDPWRVFLGTCPDRPFTSFERLLTQFRVVIHYISLILFPNPDRLVFDYDFPISTSLTAPVTTLYSLITLLTLGAASVVLFSKERLLSFCLLWFLATLVIESSVICLEIIFEHRTYLPSMFLILFFVLIFYRLIRFKTFVFCSLMLISVLFGCWTFERNKIWQDPVAFWRDSVQKYPDKPRSQNNLGMVLELAGKSQKAKLHFEKALRLYPNYSTAHYNLGILALNDGDEKQAESHFQDAIRARPDNVPAQINLAKILWKQGMVEEAISHANKALQVMPENPFANRLMGHILLRKGDIKESISFLDRGLKWFDSDTTLLLNKAEALLKTGETEKAIEQYRKIIARGNQSVPAHYNLAMLLAQKGDNDRALYHYREAARLVPFQTPVSYNLANLLYRMGKLDEAEGEYLEILKYRPVLSNALNNLGMVLEQKGELDKAVEAYTAALAILNNNELARNNLNKLQESKNSITSEKNQHTR